MITKFLHLGVLHSILLGTVVLTETAVAQIFPIQNAEQSVTIRGNNNTVTQSINQNIILRPSVSGLHQPTRFFKKEYKKVKRDFYGNKRRKKDKTWFKPKGWQKF